MSALLRTDATRTRFLARASVTSCPEEFAPPLLNDRRVTHSLEPPQEKASVADACQDGLEQFGQERLAQRVSASNERCNEVPRFVPAQVVGCEITLERRPVADRSPWQPPTVATQLIHATAHGASEWLEDTGYISSILIESTADPSAVACWICPCRPAPTTAGVDT